MTRQRAQSFLIAVGHKLLAADPNGSLSFLLAFQVLTTGRGVKDFIQILVAGLSASHAMITATVLALIVIVNEFTGISTWQKLIHLLNSPYNRCVRPRVYHRVTRYRSTTTSN